MNSKELIPAEATHPGILIRDEINALGLTNKDAAIQSGISLNVLRELIAGKRNITPSLALKLEQFLEISAEYWLRFQIKYELDILRIKHRKEMSRKGIPGQLKANMMQYISRNTAIF